MHYILKTLLSDALGLNVMQIFDLDEFKRSASAKINFSDNKVEDCLNIKPHSILFDVGIKDY
ncbi:MAG: hypothetical protein ABIP51_23945, partial [Bacteroidia bacterium]